MSELTVIPSEPLGEGIIELLESALERARAGEYSSVALATVNREGVCNREWSFAPSMGLLIGSVACLQSDLIAARNGSST